MEKYEIKPPRILSDDEILITIKNSPNFSGLYSMEYNGNMPINKIIKALETLLKQLKQ